MLTTEERDDRALVDSLRAAVQASLPERAPDVVSALRAQLLAIDVEDGHPIAPVIALVQPRRAGRVTAKRVRRSIYALSGAAAAAVAALVMLSGGALPGQPLYQVKKGAETVDMAMSSGSDKLARKRLDLAGRRVDELVTLTRSHPDRIAKPGVVDATLDDADGKVRAGAKLVTASAVAEAKPGPLLELASWARGQQETLTALLPTTRDAAEVARIGASVSLLARVEVRATLLAAQIGCPCLEEPTVDDLGPVPGKDCGDRNSPPDPSTLESPPAGSVVVIIPAPAGPTAGPVQPAPTTDPPVQVPAQVPVPVPVPTVVEPAPTTPAEPTAEAPPPPSDPAPAPTSDAPADPPQSPAPDPSPSPDPTGSGGEAGDTGGQPRTDLAPGVGGAEAP